MTERASQGDREEPTHNQLRLASVLRAIRQRGVATSADAAAATGLSANRSGTYINALRDARIVTVATHGKVDGRQSVTLREDLACLVGVDLSLNRATVAISDLAFSLLNRPEATTDDVPIERCEETLDKIARIVARESKAHGGGRPLMGVGLGLPGPVSRDAGSTASDHLLPSWKGIPVTALLTERLEAHGLPGARVIVNNDASAGALGVFTRATWMNPAGRPDDLVYVRVSSGIGMGLIIKGHLVTGADGFAGEIGHVRVAADGPVCTRCDRKGCLEVMASEHAVLDILRMHARAHGLRGPRDIGVVAAAKDAATARELGRAGWHLGFVLAGVVNVLNPTWIVLGGDLPELTPYFAKVEAAIDNYALGQARVRLKKLRWRTMFDDDSFAGAYGPDIGHGMSPELLGSLAVVIDEFGDDFLKPLAFAAVRHLKPG
jgi:predicted NBD/HSP70 family sugar kinase